MRTILRNVRQPIPILVTEVWRQNLDYAKNLQAKYFIGKNIPIYSTSSFLSLNSQIAMIVQRIIL